MLNTATGIFSCTATCSAIFMAKLVFPMEGRPATITISAGCNPEVSSSKSLKPVETPVMALSLRNSKSMRSTACANSCLTGVKPPWRPPCSAIANTWRSASSSNSAGVRPWVSNALLTISVPTRANWRSTERSRTMSA